MNHRDTIKERAGAVRPSEVRGWKGPLDVLGGTEALTERPALCFNLLVSGVNDSSALRRLYFQNLSLARWSSFHACDFSLFCFAPAFSPWLCSFFSLVEEIWSPWWQEGLRRFLVAFSYFTFIALWYVPALLNNTSETCWLWRISLQRLIPA